MKRSAPPRRLGTMLRAIGLATLAIAAAAVTWRLRPSGGISSTDPDAAIVAGCAWLAWLLAGYLAIATAAAALAHLAGGIGGAGRALRRLAPAQLRRLVDATVTLSVAATFVGTAAGGTAVAAAPRPAVVSERAPVIAGSPLDWPGLTVTSHDHHHDPPQHTHSGDVLVVQPGDTLWNIAARGLGPGASGAAITAAWHAWYHANRDVIGPNPSVIRPGQRLTTPTQQGQPR